MFTLVRDDGQADSNGTNNISSSWSQKRPIEELTGQMIKKNCHSQSLRGTDDTATQRVTHTLGGQ